MNESFPTSPAAEPEPVIAPESTETHPDVDTLLNESAPQDTAEMTPAEPELPAGSTEVSVPNYGGDTAYRSPTLGDVTPEEVRSAYEENQRVLGAEVGTGIMDNIAGQTEKADAPASESPEPAAQETGASSYADTLQRKIEEAKQQGAVENVVLEGDNSTGWQASPGEDPRSESVQPPNQEELARMETNLTAARDQFLENRNAPGAAEMQAGQQQEEPRTVAQEIPTAPTISDEEYEHFVSTGEISRERMEDIAAKIISGKKLDAREENLYKNGHDAVERHLREQQGEGSLNTEQGPNGPQAVEQQEIRPAAFVDEGEKRKLAEQAPQEAPGMPPVSGEELEHFDSTGEVSRERMEDIASKVASGGVLGGAERDILNAKGADIDRIVQERQKEKALSPEQEPDKSTPSQPETAPAVREVPAQPPATEVAQPAPPPQPEVTPQTQAEHAENVVEKFTGFAGQYAKDMYEKLSPTAKHIAEGLYMRARHNTIDRFKILYHEKVMGYHNIHNERLAQKRKDVEKEIAQLKKFQRTGGGNFEAQYGNGKKLNPHALERRLEKLEYKKDNFETRMKRRNSKMMVREVHRAEISNAYRENIYEHCAPHREKLANFGEQRDRVTEEISHFGENIAKYRKEIEAIEATLRDQLLTPEEKQKRQEQIDMVKNEIKESKRVMKEKIKRRAKVQNRMIRAEKRLDVWRDRSNEAARVAKRSVPYQDVEKRRLAFESGQQDVTVDDVPEEEATEFHVPEPEGPEAEAGGDYETLTENTLTLSNFTDAWNKEFGSEGHVNEKAFAKLLPIKKDTDVYTKDEIEKAMYEYLPVIQQNMRLRKSVKMNAADLQKRLKDFWVHQDI